MSSATRYRRAADVRFRILDGEAVVVRQRAAEVLGLDAAASRILELLDGERSLEAVIAALTAEYEGEPEAIAREVEAFVEELVAAGIVEPAGAAR